MPTKTKLNKQCLRKGGLGDLTRGRADDLAGDGLTARKRRVNLV